MTKFKKFLASLLSCCLALVLVIAAGCSAPEDSSGSSSASTSSSEEASSSSSATSSSESSSSSSTTSSSETSTSETSSSETSSSEASSSEASSSEADTSDDDDYTLTSTTVYFVGDSTVCEFSDSYYLPRYGYGTQFSNYIDSSVTVKNLALSGRSSKSFISESNYTTLTSSITKGDYLIIGFGHNDEKSDDSTRYTTPEKDAVSTAGSFQYYLYNYYIKVAEEAGATPILCTPIVRYSSDGNYTGSKAHVTSDGDYAACILDLAEDYNITCVDLTSITKADYTTLGEDAQWYHAHTGVTLSDDSSAREIGVTGSTDTVKVVATGRDDTHLNMYGAKMVAYEIATALQSARKTCNLGYYVNSSISAPTADDLEAAYNSSYTYTYYNAFDASTDVSTNWTLKSSGWYGSALGYLGGNSVSPYTITETTEGVISVGSTNNGKGKISSDGDGFAIAFMQLAYNQNFEMTVTATVTMADGSSTEGTASTSQSGFGIMLRDDMYIDTRNDTLTSNYVTAGMYRASSATNMMHYRESGTLTTTGKSTTSNYSVGDTATLTIVRTGQNITCTVVYNGTTYTYTHYDFDLVAVDSTYMYLGLYATRGTVVEYSNIIYTATGTAGDA